MRLSLRAGIAGALPKSLSRYPASIGSGCVVRGVVGGVDKA